MFAFFHAQDSPHHKNYPGLGTSLVVEWLRLHASTAGGVGLIPGQGTNIPYAPRLGKKNAGDAGLVPGSGRSPGEGNENPVLPGKSPEQRRLVEEPQGSI